MAEATQQDLNDAVEDVRMEQGIVHQQMREDWRNELRLELRSFKNEVRILLVVAILILKFNLPSSWTVGALGAVGVKAALGFFRP